MSALVLRESINHVAAQLENPHLDDIHEFIFDEEVRIVTLLCGVSSPDVMALKC